jgi:integrase
MAGGKFTHRAVEALKQAPKRRIVWEPSGHGQGNLGLRISPTGLKTWVFMYRHEGRPRMLSLGNFPAVSVEAAHAAAAKAALAHAHGEDPAAPAVESKRSARAMPTVQELADDYLERYARPFKRSADRDEALLRRNVLPKLGAKKASAIRRTDIVALLDDVITRGALTQTNRTHSVLSKMFNWAVERGIVEVSPVAGYKAPVKESSGRERCLSDDELRVFLTKLDTAAVAPVTRLALRFALLTAARPGEVTGAPWSEIDEKEAIWHLPAARTKNGQKHDLPLSPQALVVLAAARELDRGAGWVFPSPQFRKGKALNVGALAHGITDNIAHFGLAPFYAHDLRRTAATGVAELGADWTLLQKLLNHKLRGETAKYVRHGYAEEMREVLGRWGARVEALGRAEGEVVDDADDPSPALVTW